MTKSQSKYWYWLKYFLLGVSLCLFILLHQGEIGRARLLSSDIVATAIEKEAQQHIQARSLTEKGHQQLNVGQAAAALKTWQEATKIYQQLRHHDGVTGSIINQSLALQSLGLYPRACKTLLQALELEEWLCESVEPDDLTFKETRKPLNQALEEKSETPVVVTGLHTLADILRLIGKPDESETVLQHALLMAKRLNQDPLVDNIQLSLANTQTTLYKRAQGRYQITEEPLAKDKLQWQALDQASAALKIYQQVAKSPYPSTVLQAQLNQLSLILELEQWTAVEAQTNSALKAWQSSIRSQIQPLVKPLLAAQFSQLPALASIYARLNFANNLIQISQSGELKQSLFQRRENPLLVGLQIAKDALQIAQNLDNQRAGSSVYGTIGSIYTHLARTTESKQYLETALEIAQSVQAWDLAYQWQQQLGRLYQQTGHLELATRAYGSAISSLEQVRSSILSVNPEIQFSFKEKVEPIYREYLRLLLAAPTPNLDQIIQTNERLQLAELENFLQCGKLDLVSLNEIQSVNMPTVIHILNLEERVEVIVRSSHGDLRRHTPNPERVKHYISSLVDNLHDNRFVYTDEQWIISSSQALYNLLIAPIKPYLPKSGTLVFVLDSAFQGLPMGILHDGNNYLLKQYSISVTLSSQLRQPQALPPNRLKALVAGLSKVSPSFKDPKAPKNLRPLPEVKTEVEDVKENTASSVELLDEQFTSDRFGTVMSNEDFPVVHITTHGQFSSDPLQTVLLAWDKLINVQQLNRLLRAKVQGTQDSIELLVLSACQTAKGDKRSALGIAGVAAQAGARSTVASLWLVDAQSTAQLMREFYKGLKAGQSKAEALRQAQMSLLLTSKYQHPYYWAGFLLIGSWL